MASTVVYVPAGAAVVTNGLRDEAGGILCDEAGQPLLDEGATLAAGGQATVTHLVGSGSSEVRWVKPTGKTEVRYVT